MASQSGLSLLDLLDQAADRLTPQERRLAAHLVERLEQWGYLSSSELARELGVHRSTVVRFAQTVGFRGYPELQEAARSAYHRTVAANSQLVLTGETDGKLGRVQAVFNRELENLQRSYSNLDMTALEETASCLARARRVVVYGRRFSQPLALHLAQLLRTMRERVDSAPSAGGSAVDLLFDLTPEDLVLVVSLRRHSPEVQRTLRFLTEAGVPVTVLTDASPGNDLAGATRVLRAHVGGTSMLDSYTALVSVAHSLMTLVETALPDAAERLARVEQAWDHFNKS